MSLLLSSILCLSLAMPTMTFGADDNVELNITDITSNNDEIEENNNEIILESLESDEVEQGNNEAILNW